MTKDQLADIIRSWAEEIDCSLTIDPELQSRLINHMIQVADTISADVERGPWERVKEGSDD